jgi:hypothetical protein
MKKTIVSALTVVFLSLLAGPGPLAAQTASGFETRPDANGLVITKYTGPGGAVAIPEAIDGRPVTAIGDWAFSGCLNLTSITIPGSVTAIGTYAFFECSGLTSITLSEGLTTIGNSAFSSCLSLASLTLPGSLTAIGDSAFSRCSRLVTINVSPENQWYKDIDGVVFSKDGKTLCAYPTGNTRSAYAIPEGVTTIGIGAFFGCSSLTSLTLPGSVTTFGAVAFADCTALTSLSIPGSVTTIGNSAFYYCSSLSSLSIPEGVTTIDEGAFYGCSSLKPDIRAEIERRFGSGVFVGGI